VRRRQFITLLGGAAAWLLAARVQQGDSLPRVVYLERASRGARFLRRLAGIEKSSFGSYPWADNRCSIACGERGLSSMTATTFRHFDMKREIFINLGRQGSVLCPQGKDPGCLG
jgi:hypothetical protein